jgi:hypothetical protein
MDEDFKEPYGRFVRDNPEDSTMVKTLVVEVSFDTDPNNESFRQGVIDAIRDTAGGVLENETTMIVSHLKIVPKGLK